MHTDFLDGYGPLIQAGTWVTIKLAVLSLLLALFLGLIAALAKLSKSIVLRSIGTAYTTLIRSIPDLVLMLLLFYSLQILLNHITDFFHWDDINIDPFTAGVIVIGFIYGAYFAETFRAAFLSVPYQQFEAGSAYGLNQRQIFTHIIFPQMIRHALPGLGNNWQVLVKSTALVSLIGLSDLVQAIQDAGRGTFRFFFFITICGAIYLLITTVSHLFLLWLEKYYAAETNAKL